MCSEHKFPLDFYCESCEQIICSRCIVNQHKKHEFSELSLVLGKLKSLLQQSLLSAQSSREDLLKAIQYLQQQIEQLKVENVKTITHVQNVVADLHTKLETREKELIDHINTTVEKNSALLQNQIEVFSKVTTEAQVHCVEAAKYEIASRDEM